MPHPDTNQRFDVDGVEVFADGDGPHALVMIHGWPDGHGLWDAQVAHFKSRYRCVRFTLPGYDLSRPARPTSLAGMVELFSAIVDRVSPDRPVTLLLHDWGCIFGYELAARHPQRVARVIGVDIGDHNSKALMRSLSLESKLRIVRYQMALMLAWKLGGRAGDLIARRVARMLRCPTDASKIGWQMGYPYAMRWLGAYGGLRDAAEVVPSHPTLYLYGERKPYLIHSPDWLQALASVPGGRAIGFATGHWLMLEQPDAFNARVTEWLAQTSAHET